MKVEYTKSSGHGTKNLGDFPCGTLVKIDGYTGVTLITNLFDLQGGRLCVDMEGVGYYPGKLKKAFEVAAKLVVEGSEDDF